MPRAKTKRAYTLKEQRTLTVIASMPDSKERRGLVDKFSKDNRRTKPAIYNYLSKLKGAQPGKRKKAEVPKNTVRFKISSMVIQGDELVVTF